jgi:acetylornithine/N-succinyldiaminopimelate aminotransferase
MNTQDRENRYILHTYKRLPIEIDRADGVYIYGKDGKKYLDFFGGIAVNALGYNHPRVKAAINAQVERYMHVSNLFFMDVQVDLAETICKISGYPKVFLTNSGTEAIEAAIKISRKWGSTRNKSGLIALTNSFHGRTMGALSLTDRPKYRQGFEPFLPGVSHVGFNNVEDLRAHVNGSTAAVFVEFVQGEGGVNVMSREFADELFALKRKMDFLIVADEIQGGLFRTGRVFSFEHFGVRPDIVTMAKPLGGGLPLGGVLVDEHLQDVLGYGAHGTTFGGNPVACAAGLATLRELSEKKMELHAAEVGSYLAENLRELGEKFPDFITEVRGLGLMVGVACKTECAQLVSDLLLKGVLANCTNGNVIRLLPPLIIEKEHVDLFVSVLGETVLEHSKVTTK